MLATFSQSAPYHFVCLLTDPFRGFPLSCYPPLNPMLLFMLLVFLSAVFMKTTSRKSNTIVNVVSLQISSYI